jgi:DNA-binding CsgD family transcriptional regulator
MARNELRSQMALHGDTNQSLADALGISYGAFSQKINGKQSFTQREIQIIIDRYDLTAENTQRIFFTPEVSK